MRKIDFQLDVLTSTDGMTTSCGGSCDMITAEYPVVTDEDLAAWECETNGVWADSNYLPLAQVQLMTAQSIKKATSEDTIDMLLETLNRKGN